MIVKDEHVKPRIGFMGMGRMGSHMALRLLGAHYSLSVYDRAEAKTQPIYPFTGIPLVPRILQAYSQTWII
ncbi:MAG TPA: NAD(P)-binding domain-containing protein [Nitrososphaera sp.]|nr:NAD(P)-binding domain-containing protein [Nitrososphaera sp.]